MIASVSSSIATVHSAVALSRAPAERLHAGAANPGGLTDEERQEVQRLKERDREVRAHEQAHARAGGPYASPPSYDYARGPDGRLYAVSGEVRIDTAPIPDNPAATIAKMEIVMRAAQAPQDSSAQDRRVAAEARAALAEAQAELNAKKQEESRRTGDDIGGAHRHAAAAYADAERLAFGVGEFALSIAA